MGRGYPRAEYTDTIARVRRLMPDAGITTDVIGAFPGETEAQFDATCRLLEEWRFDKVHVAAYSPRPGTIAYRKMADDVPDEEKKARLQRVEQIQERIAAEINARLLGTTQEILIEGLALAAFQRIRDQSKNPLAAAVNAYVMQDEARHVAFGRLALRDYYPKLSESERDEREEFVVDACYRMRDRFLAQEVWEWAGIDQKAACQVMLDPPVQKEFRRVLFSKIVPNCKKLGLLDAVPKDQKGLINFQMKSALDKVAFLPFGKLIAQWRWDVFSGKTTPATYNAAWVELRRDHPTAFVVDKANVDSGGKTWFLKPNGTGPYKLGSYNFGQQIVLTRNDIYYGTPKPQVKTVTLSISGGSFMTRYENGELDSTFVSIIDTDRVLDPTNALNKELTVSPQFSIDYIGFNVSKPPFDDPKVRQAFNMAIDKVNYSKSRLVTKPLSAFTPEGIFVGYPQPKGEGFDPEQARTLLGDAVFPVTKQADGSFQCKAFPIKEVEYLFNTNSSNKAMAEFIQAQWKQNLGITVPLRSMEFKTFLRAFIDGAQAAAPLRTLLQAAALYLGVAILSQVSSVAETYLSELVGWTRSGAISPPIGRSS